MTTFTASPVFIRSIAFQGLDKKTHITIYTDGRVELKKGLTLDEAATTFWQAVKYHGIDVRKQALTDAMKECKKVLTEVEPGSDSVYWNQAVEKCLSRLNILMTKDAK